MTLILTHSDIDALIDRAAIYRVVEQAHIDLTTGDAVNPAPAQLPLIDGGTALPMVASSHRSGASVVKMLSDMPLNGARGLPSQRSTIMLLSARTGECEAVLDGRLITAIRTAAASAVATAHLARAGVLDPGIDRCRHTGRRACPRDLCRQADREGSRVVAVGSNSGPIPRPDNRFGRTDRVRRVPTASGLRRRHRVHPHSVADPDHRRRLVPARSPSQRGGGTAATGPQRDRRTWHG